MLVGVLAGAAGAPALIAALGITSDVTKPLAAVVVLVLGASLGSTAGYWLGAPLRRLILRARTGSFDRVAGAALSALAVLAVAWFLGITFDRGPNADLARLIERSAILRVLDSGAPRLPGFLQGVEKILAGAPFPQIFAGLQPSLPSALTPPSSVDTPGVRKAAAVTVRIESHGCGGIVSGSGFPVGAGYVVTNAHVVSGTTATQVFALNSARPLKANVVVFDPSRDVAVLYVPGLSLEPLAAAPGERGTLGAVIGYPGGGSEETQPAVVDGAITAQGRDIYNQSLVRREVFVIQSVVKPGNSGGPLVDLAGHVLGIVFAASSTDPGQAFALTNAEVQPDVQLAHGRTAPIATQNYQCAV